MEFVFRFIAGGTIVAMFAALGDVLKPKSFAGLFGAAPSVALATITLTVFADGKQYASIESRSMMVGAIAFFSYTVVCCQTMMRWRVRGSYAAGFIIPIWFAVAFVLWVELLK